MGDMLDRKLQRLTMTGEIPEAARVWPSDISKFKLRQLDLGAELDAAKAAAINGGTDDAMSAELLRRAVVEVDGKKVDDLDWLEDQSPQTRGYLRIAYLKLQNHGVADEDIDAFKKGLTITVG